MSPPRPSQSPSYSSCGCMATALQMLELLESNNIELESTALDHVLVIQKNAVSQCLPILECQACNAAPALGMRMTVICEKILIAFESFPTRLQGWRLRPIGSYSHGDPNKSKMGETQKFFLGVYEVESEHEQRILLRSLAVVQLQEFHRVLIKLEEVALTRKWEIHQSLLTSLILRLQNTATGWLRVPETTYLG